MDTQSAIPLTFRGIDAEVRDLRCPKCGEAYLSEETCIAKCIKGEKMVEAKG